MISKGFQLNSIVKVTTILVLKNGAFSLRLNLKLADKVYGMNITIETSTKDDNHALALLKKFGMPFKSA